MKCPNCTNDLEQGTQYCGNCGFSLVPHAPVPPPVQQSPQQFTDNKTVGSDQAPDQNANHVDTNVVQPVASINPSPTTTDELRIKAQKANKAAGIAGIVVAVLLGLSTLFYLSDDFTKGLPRNEVVAAIVVNIVVSLIYLVCAVLIVVLQRSKKVLTPLYVVSILTVTLLLLTLLSGSPGGLLLIGFIIFVSRALRASKAVK